MNTTVTEETLALLTLNSVPGLGPVRIGRLLKLFSSASEVLRASASTLSKVEGIGKQLCEAVLKARKNCDPEVEWKRIEAFGAKVLPITTPEYPPLLRHITAPPPVLYVWGNLRHQPAIAVVGTRNSTSYGIECAKKLSFQLAYSGVTIVSGLARGIDSFAHQGALAAQGQTIAVLGSGFCKLYPPENQTLAERIASSGAVISELPMLAAANRQTFPARNRIISGLSLGVLVVEAGAKSGALLTAYAAVDQGRSVYAIPGRMDRSTSAGSNALLKQGAKLVTCAQDILDDFSLLFREPPALARPSDPPADLSPEQKKIFSLLGGEPLHLDAVAAQAKLPVALVSSTLLSLELAGWVRQLAGRHFIKRFVTDNT
ncbi:MAG: DNA-protecting protein DprA [Verrucomicrobia bacterium]|nr:MAG: DNA-protecting protein DprA [Verrucomicrobiota bacterium]